LFDYIIQTSRGNVADAGVMDRARGMMKNNPDMDICAALEKILAAAKAVGNTQEARKIVATQKANDCLGSIGDPVMSKWYLAEIVEEITVEDDPRRVMHNNLVLIQASSPDDAYSRAISTGHAREVSFINPAGSWEACHD
jgi:Bacterial toxin 34/Domain of unknown function (DUF4288)